MLQILFQGEKNVTASILIPLLTQDPLVDAHTGGEGLLRSLKAKIS